MAALFKTRVRVPRPARRPARPPLGVAVLAALLGVVALAALAGGAVDQPEKAWLEAAVALAGILTAAAWLGSGGLRAGASPLAIAAAVLLGGYAVWAAASLIWSVAPDRSWSEANRAIAYAVLVAVALVVGGAVPRAIERIAAGWLIIATAIALYALAGKVLPGVLDHAATVARLRAPLDYWNALGLVCGLASPVAIRIAIDQTRRSPTRCAALVALLLLVATLGMTYSRGGFVALAVVLVVLTVAGGARLRGLAVAGLVAIAVAPVLALAWGDAALAEAGVALAERKDAGLVLGGVIVLSAIALVAAGLFLARLETRVGWNKVRSQIAWFAIAALLVAGAAAGITAMAVSDDGLGGSIDNAVDTFTEPSSDRTLEPGRLLSTSSANRWPWWEEAFGAWADEPVLGWGADAFPVSRRLYRATTFDTEQAHSLPLDLMAGTGLVGLLLVLGALGLLLAAAIRRVRALPGGRERDLAVALLAAAVAWSVHALVDRDWQIPGVTIPVLLFLGVLAARPPAPRPEPVVALGEPSRIGRVLALAGVSLLLCVAIASAVLPAWSDGLSDDALQTLEKRSEPELKDGAADAERAADLDPLAVRPLFVAASIAEARGRVLEARAYLLEAVERQPWSAEGWRRLASLATGLADRRGALRATARLVALDPANPRVILFARGAQGVLAPPEASPTATGTPLPAPPGTAVPAPGVDGGQTPDPSGGGDIPPPPGGALPEAAPPGEPPLPDENAQP